MTAWARSCSACFTGHRDLAKEQLTAIMDEVSTTVIGLMAQGITHYYAGGALGFDLVASVAVLNLKNRYPMVTLTLALPCREHMKGWGRIDREIFRGVMARADETVYVSEEYFRGCMQVRNRYMVDRSTLCLAYLSECRGGTYQTVCYAKKQGIPIVNLAGTALGEQLTFSI